MDANSALPIRTEGDLQEKVQTKIVDFIDPSKGAEVDSDSNLHVELHGNDPAGTDKVVKLSESGNIQTDGVYDVTNNSNPSSVGLIGHVRNAAKTMLHQLLRITAIASSVDADVVAMDVAIRDEQGNPYTAANPLPVTSVDSEGQEVNHYETDAAVAAGAVGDHDYSVTALKTLKLSKVIASGSGKIKAELKIETGPATGVYTTKFVQFNSVANPNIEFDVKELITVPAGVKVRLSITNKEQGQAQDVYSTISGHEID